MRYSERDRKEDIDIRLILLYSYNILHTYFIYLFNINWFDIFEYKS